MDWHGKSLKLGLLVIVGALALRLFAGGGFDTLAQFFSSREVVSVLLFLETGRVVTPSPAPPDTQSGQAEETVPPATEPAPPEQLQAVFSSQDAALVEVNNVCGYEAAVEQRLTQTLSWELTEDAPTVLIVHSHATESYENTENYVETAGYRTKDVAYNVVSIGDRLVQALEKGGIHALHDRQLHDSPSYSDSYVNSRKSVEDYLKQYPSIRLVLDIHRDSVTDERGKQLRYTVESDSGPVARLMMVVGTDAGGLTHPGWPENMSLAVKLHAQLEKNLPGVCRPISFRSQRFNQDLSPGALIVEVGSAGNTRQEALAAAEVLAQAVIDLAHGAGGEKN